MGVSYRQQHYHCSRNRALYLLTFVILLSCSQSLLLQSTSTENGHRGHGKQFGTCHGKDLYPYLWSKQPWRLVPRSRLPPTTLYSVTPLALTTHGLVAPVSSPSPSNHHQHWYRISAILMALSALGLFCLTPSLFIHPSTYSVVKVSSLSLLQQRQTSLATLWGSAASFGIASFLFQWIPKQQQQQQLHFSSCLNKQLHFGLFVFCTLGLVAIPGEFGMRLVVMNALGSSSSSLPSKILPQAISIAGQLVATMARVTGLGTAILGIQTAYKSTTPSTSTSMVQSDQVQNSPEISEESSSLPILTKRHWFHRLWIVPKSYRKQSLFYRNIMLVFMTVAGSNLMEALFRWRVCKFTFVCAAQCSRCLT